ncbi:intercellular adhesion molecule 2 isoform X4 [Camelus bactrianus]
MSPFCCWGLCVAFLALLCCPGSGEEAFEVHVSPEQPMVKHGGSQVINCSTNCTKPENGGLETSLDKIVLQDSPQWKLFMIFNVSQNSSMRCFFWCSRKQGSKSLNVGLYYPPKQVLLKLQPTRVAVGSPFTIECRVPSVAPLEGLTVTLLRGSEVLHSQTFEGTALSPQEAMVTYSAEAQLEDSSHNFSCQAKMDLRTRGVKVVDSVSDSQALEVFGEGEPPEEVEGDSSRFSPSEEEKAIALLSAGSGGGSHGPALVPRLPSSAVSSLELSPSSQSLCKTTGW